MDVAHILSASVAPVVLISACGLLTLALYNRLATILTRLRSCHQQQFDVLKQLDLKETTEARTQLDLVNEQMTKVTRKAKTVQKALYCLLSSVVAFLGCSLFAALAVFQAYFGGVAVALHIAGLLLFISGVGWAIKELALSIAPLDDVNAYLETAVAGRTHPADRQHYAA